MDERGFELEPNKFILAQTLETITLRLPQELEDEASEKPVLAARVEGKSSRARFGLLIHFTAPTIHAGWSGPIALK
jgi:dCTP deaminase